MRLHYPRQGGGTEGYLDLVHLEIGGNAAHWYFQYCTYN